MSRYDDYENANPLSGTYTYFPYIPGDINSTDLFITDSLDAATSSLQLGTDPLETQVIEIGSAGVTTTVYGAVNLLHPINVLSATITNGLNVGGENHPRQCLGNRADVDGHRRIHPKDHDLECDRNVHLRTLVCGELLLVECLGGQGRVEYLDGGQLLRVQCLGVQARCEYVDGHECIHDKLDGRERANLDSYTDGLYQCGRPRGNVYPFNIYFRHTIRNGCTDRAKPVLYLYFDQFSWI